MKTFKVVEGILLIISIGMHVQLPLVLVKTVEMLDQDGLVKQMPLLQNLYIQLKDLSGSPQEGRKMCTIHIVIIDIK